METLVEASGSDLVPVLVEEKQNRPGTFAKGVDERRVHQQRQEAEDLSIPELLRDLRHVRTKNKKQDRTPSRRQLRTLAEKDQKTFLAMWKEEERLYAESQRSKDGAEERAVADGGTVKCLELVERLLSEFEGGSR